MSSLLDIIGSFIIGGLLLLMILSVNTNMHQMSFEDRLELSIQENLYELTAEIDYDFRKMGYGVQNGSLAIIRADSNSISFWADLDNNGTLEQVAYRLGPVSEVSGTENPNDRILHRLINGRSVGGSLGIVEFRLALYDIGGAQTWDTKVVKSLDYYIALESPYPIDGVYARSVWNGTVRPRNL